MSYSNDNTKSVNDMNNNTKIGNNASNEYGYPRICCLHVCGLCVVVCMIRYLLLFVPATLKSACPEKTTQKLFIVV